MPYVLHKVQEYELYFGRSFHSCLYDSLKQFFETSIQYTLGIVFI